MTDNKYKLLKRGIIYDLIGMATLGIPVIGPLLDLIWAPIAAYLMKRMYKGNEGKIASVVVFLEEILPVTDMIPSFTLMWLYTYVWKKQPTTEVIRAEIKR